LQRQTSFESKRSPWWRSSVVVLSLIPLGSLILLVSAFGGMLIQLGLMIYAALALVAIVAGLAIGFSLLWAIRRAELDVQSHRRATWLAWATILGPLVMSFSCLWAVSMMIGALFVR
jgi:uncharacterized membrane protein